MKIDLKKRRGIETTRVIEERGIPYISYRSLEAFPWLLNAFSTRIGGISTGDYASMNLSFTVGDDKERVRKNFSVFGDAIHVQPSRMVYSHQTHTVNVMEVTDEHLGMGILRERSFSDIDGIMTNVSNVCLVTGYADCVPLYFVDPVHRAIALSHSGWRGTIGDICKETVVAMKKRYQSRPEELIACIGPSICADCYEVGADVADRFLLSYGADSGVVLPAGSGEKGKYQLDLTQANLINMERTGIKREHISCPDLCTSCNRDVLHSHRASGGKRGGLCAFLMIKGEETEEF